MTGVNFSARWFIVLALFASGLSSVGCSHSAVLPAPGLLSENKPGAVTLRPPSFYLSFAELNEIATVDPTTGEISGVFAVHLSPAALLSDSVRNLVVAQAFGSNSIAFIDTQTQKIEGSVTLPESPRSWSIASKADFLYVAGAQTVYAISLKSRSIVGSASLTSGIASIVAVPEQHKVFATLPDINRIAVIDTPSYSVEKKPIFAGPCSFGFQKSPCHPEGIAASSDGRYVVALARGKRTAIGIDARTNAIIAKTVNARPCIGHYPGFIGINAVTEVGWYAPCDREGPGAVSLEPPFSQPSVSGFMLQGYFPFGAAFDPSGSGFVITYCVGRCIPGRLYRITAGNAIEGSIKLPSPAFGIAYAH